MTEEPLDDANTGVVVTRAPQQGTFWRMMFTRARIALAVAILGALILGAVGGIVAYPKRSLYTSTTIMLIDDPLNLATAPSDGPFLQLSELRLKYTALVNTDLIAKPVAKRLEIPVAYIINAVVATAPTNNLLVDVTAQAKTANDAEILSEDTAEELNRYVLVEDKEYQIPKINRFTLNIIQNASPGTRTSRSKTYDAAVAAALAVLGFLAGFVITQLIRNRELAR